MTTETKAKHQHVEGDGSWWAHDMRGIPLALVCRGCIKQKLAGFQRDAQ